MPFEIIGVEVVCMRPHRHGVDLDGRRDVEARAMEAEANTAAAREQVKHTGLSTGREPGQLFLQDL